MADRSTTGFARSAHGARTGRFGGARTYDSTVTPRRALVLLVLGLGVAACDVPADDAPPETPRARRSKSVNPLHEAELRCFPQTTTLLDEATKALALGQGLKGEALVRDAESPWRSEPRRTSCPNEVGERVRVRRLALRHAALREEHADDLEILLDLGSESFETSACNEALMATCEDALGWFSARFPAFTDGSTIRIRPFARLPITPQPGGRLTVEAMETLESRLAASWGEYFALGVAPTVRIDGPGVVELRVDGADVLDEGQPKLGAHFVVALPSGDMVRATSQGPLVVVLKKNELRRTGTTWRSSGRLAYVAP